MQQLEQDTWACQLDTLMGHKMQTRNSAIELFELEERISLPADYKDWLLRGRPWPGDKEAVLNINGRKKTVVNTRGPYDVIELPSELDPRDILANMQYYGNIFRASNRIADRAF